MLLVDDGSTDQTKKVIKPFLEDDRIRYFYQENEGQGSARNKAIDQAKGIYLALLDADDVWDEDRLQSQLNVMLQEEVSLVFSKFRRIASDGQFLNKYKGNGTGYYQGFSAFFLLAGGYFSIANSSVLVKKDSVESVGRFDESEEARNIEDYHLWFRMLLAGCTFFGTNDVLGAYRIHKNQVTYNDSGQSPKIIAYLERLSMELPERKAFFQFLILRRLSMYYKQHNDKQKAKAICLRIYFSNECINSHPFEKYLINGLGLIAYFRFRRLYIRRFRRFKTFVGSARS